jgi:hypothetical protein
MANRRYSLTKILAGHSDAPYDPKRREFIEQIASALYERHEQFARWPESVRMFYACYDINFQVGNGGFSQAADNVPELLPIAKEAFEQFGRKRAADLCGRALSMLSGSSGSEWTELDEETLPNEFWADDALQELVQQHRQDFVLVDRIK